MARFMAESFARRTRRWCGEQARPVGRSVEPGPPVSGPLSGVVVVEMAGLGPAPFAGMVLADMGAEVIRVDRVDTVDQSNTSSSNDVLGRGRRSIAIDLKDEEGVQVTLRLLESADALIEGFRPGVMERLGLGPDTVLERNPRLVYGRITGWGQDGPYAQIAGHDINYIALSGVLYHLGRSEAPPTPPLALVGDFGGGGLLLAYGIACAMHEAVRSGRGQVIDAAMVEGAALLSTIFHGGDTKDAPRGMTIGNGASHFYDTYETADHRFVSVGPLEPKFYAEFIELLGLDPEQVPQSFEPSDWGPLKEIVAAAFREKTRDEWCAIFQGSDACFAPVLSMREAWEHPHNRYRRTFIDVGGTVQPGPAPRFSRTSPRVPSPPPRHGANTVEVLRGLGLDEAELVRLRERGTIS
jgi:alpha-methylacyl-CoA racemase